MPYPTQPDHPLPPHDPAQPAFRSSAVARMAGMPVATLRVWEQRYQAVGPHTAATGHRLYSAADVERVTLLRQLTEFGHAIGSLATLDTEQLRQVVLTHTAARENADRREGNQRHAPVRTVVVGQALARRLLRPAVQHHGTRPLELVGVFDSLNDAAQAGQTRPEAVVDLLLWQAPSLQADTWPLLQAAQMAWRAQRVAVAYRFAGTAARHTLASAGVVLAQETEDDGALGRWLSSLTSAQPSHVGSTSPTGPSTDAEGWPLDGWTWDGRAAPARRFDDASLTDFAALSSRIACECPSQLAQVLMQVASFERYSADCTSRNPADAALHAYLHRVAGAARVLFEAALERVAEAEGLALPP